MPLGIDIGSKTIKIVELKNVNGKFALKGAAVVGVKEASIERMQEETEFVALANIIKTTLKNAKIGSKEVNISLPESAAFTRNIKFPPLTDAEIASAVKWQAEEIIPIPLKDVVFQHIILDRNENTQPPEVSVLVVAAPKTLVEKYIKIMTLAGLEVVGIETELLALCRCLSVPAQTVVIVDLGARSTDIAIAKNTNEINTCIEIA